MLSKCEVHNVNGINIYPLDSNPDPFGFSALKAFDVHVDNRTITDRNKQQAHGIWPTKSYRGGMSIDAEATLQADTPANVLTQLAELTGALFGNPTDSVNDRHMGTIILRRLDATEDWKADFTVLAFTPKVSAETTTIDYLITFFCWNPWFIGVGTSGLYYWA